MMKISILTLFPEMCEQVLDTSIIGRARKKGLFEAKCFNIRDYTLDKQKRVDDAPYGGGMGMVMQADPIYRCYEAATAFHGEKPHVIYMSPQGSVFCQQKAIELSKMENIMLLCGHYEGVDERVIEEIVDEEISVGDYVLSGGELPALCVCDALLRMQQGVLSDDVCFEDESHYGGMLEYPQYTHPREWHGKTVPDILLSGHHGNIKRWRDEQSYLRTLRKRPDLIEKKLKEKKNEGK